MFFQQSNSMGFNLRASRNVSLAEDVSAGPNNNDTSLPGAIGLRKVEDGSVISNEHTAKWRIFTDSGRDFFLKGNIPQAEKIFVSALQEAKEGFGEMDPHVAAACNNLIKRRVLGEVHPEYGDTMYQLGTIRNERLYMNMG